MIYCLYANSYGLVSTLLMYLGPGCRHRWPTCSRTFNLYEAVKTRLVSSRFSLSWLLVIGVSWSFS